MASITYDDLDLVNESHEEEDLLYPPEDDSLHVEIYDEDTEPLPLLAGDDASKSSAWGGTLSLKDFNGTFSTKRSAGVIHLDLSPKGDDDRVIAGTGLDGSGDFVVDGRIRCGRLIAYNQLYNSSTAGKRRFQGTINWERKEIEGVWGPLGDLGEDFNKALEDSDVSGSFVLVPISTRFAYLEPSQDELSSNKPLAMWRFAIHTVVNLLRIRAGRFSWSYLSDRRRVRKRFLDLYHRLDDESFSWVPYDSRPALSLEESDELASLVMMCSKHDLQFYRRLSKTLQRRGVFHW